MAALRIFKFQAIFHIIFIFAKVHHKLPASEKVYTVSRYSLENIYMILENNKK